jgi:hypothetical protein
MLSNVLVLQRVVYSNSLLAAASVVDITKLLLVYADEALQKPNPLE